jgi:hypothetical protein
MGDGEGRGEMGWAEQNRTPGTCLVDDDFPAMTMIMIMTMTG